MTDPERVLVVADAIAQVSRKWRGPSGDLFDGVSSYWSDLARAAIDAIDAADRKA